MNYSKLNSHLNVVLINISLLYTGEQIRKRGFLFIDIWLNKAKWNLLTLSMERSERKAVLYNSLLHVFLQLFHSGLLQNNTVCASYFLLKEKKSCSYNVHKLFSIVFRAIYNPFACVYMISEAFVD